MSIQVALIKSHLCTTIVDKPSYGLQLYYMYITMASKLNHMLLYSHKEF